MSETFTTVYVRTEPEPIPEEFRDGLVIDYFNSNPRACTLDLNLEPIYQVCGRPSQAALDFALLASAAYVADKKVLRKSQVDAWTRHYHLCVPVKEPDLWRSLSVLIAQTLSFLTGDVWHLSFRPSKSWIYQPGLQLSKFDRSLVVCLFSGGLDSTIGTLNLLENGKNVLLIGHYDNNHTKNDQTIVLEELIGHYQPECIGQLQIRIRPALKTERQTKSLPSIMENSTRSRSLVFLAVGLLAASAISPDTELFIPENGFISLNVPLTPSRRGSNSTRTTHPHFIDGILSLLKNIGLSNPIRNPFTRLTKGEMVQKCPNQTALKHLAKVTISCSHPEVLRFRRKQRNNCGYCYPCIIRRAALYSARLDDSNDYGWDVCRDVGLVRDSGRGKDARAIFLSLNEAKQSKHTFLSLASGGPLNQSTVSLTNLRDMYIRGLTEIERLFVEQASPEVLRLAGLY